jgi:hypothetical protein
MENKAYLEDVVLLHLPPPDRREYVPARITYDGGPTDDFAVDSMAMRDGFLRGDFSPALKILERITK